MLVYLSIYVAAIIEGEAYYIIQCSLAAHGTLQWLPVMSAGALGGATGDNFWFYLLRGRVHWLDRYPKIAKFERRVSRHVRKRETLIILACRFLPGLRTAIPAACAVANVRRDKFTALVDAAKLASPSGLDLHVNRDNARAIRFYQKHGFVISCEELNPRSGAPVYKMSWRS